MKISNFFKFLQKISKFEENHLINRKIEEEDAEIEEEGKANEGKINEKLHESTFGNLYSSSQSEMF